MTDSVGGRNPISTSAYSRGINIAVLLDFKAVDRTSLSKKSRKEVSNTPGCFQPMKSFVSFLFILGAED